MQVDVFKVFCDLSETGSFSKAATINDITQSAVSQQIRMLEGMYKVTLMKRGGRNFSLTPEGAAFLEASKEILDIYNNLGDRIHEMRNVVAGELKIASIFSIGMHELPAILKRYRKQHPEVEVHVEYRRNNQVLTQVLEGEVDIGLIAYPQKRRGLIIEPFTESPLVLICHPSHHLASKKTIAVSELSGEKFISFSPDLPTRKAIDHYLRDNNAAVEIVHEFDNVETLKRGVEIEHGISIVPQDTVSTEIKTGQLVAVELTPELLRPLGILLRNKRTRTPAQREFIAMLQKQKQETAE